MNPSDIAPALVALNASIVTTTRTINAENFWDFQVNGSTVLAANEIVTKIQIPRPSPGARSAFIKLAVRKAIDFAIVNCAVLCSGGVMFRIVLGGVYNKPFRATAAETACNCKTINATMAAAAGTAAVSTAVPMPIGATNTYKVPMANTIVKRTILATLSSPAA